MQKTHLQPEQVWNHFILRMLIQRTSTPTYAVMLPTLRGSLYGTHEKELNGKIVYTIELDDLKQSHFGMLNDTWRVSHDLKKKSWSCAHHERGGMDKNLLEGAQLLQNALCLRILHVNIL